MEQFPPWNILVGFRNSLKGQIGATVAAWLISALNLLRTIAFGTPARAAITGAGAAVASPFASIGGLLGFGGDEDRVRRRRRRRALTQSDRNDIAFIAATIGKAAAGSFAVQLATRSR